MPSVRPEITTITGASGSVTSRRMIATPWSGEIGVTPSRESASTTDSRSPIPTPDQTDHSMHSVLQAGLRRATCSVRSASHSFAVA